MALAGAQQHVAWLVAAGLQASEDFFGGGAEVDAEVVDQLQPAVAVQLGVEGHFGVGGAALDQGAAGVVADAADDRGADAGGADHRVGFAAVFLQAFFQFVQGGAGQADDLFGLVEQLDAVQPHGVDDDEVAVVAVIGRGRATGQAGVGSLADDDGIGLDAGLQYLPVFEQGAGAHHRQGLSVTKAVTGAEAFGVGGVGQQVGLADDVADPVEKRMLCHGRSGQPAGRPAGR